MLEKMVPDTIYATQRIGETALKGLWSRLDAAAQKPRPSEYLGQSALRSIQGRDREVQ